MLPRLNKSAGNIVLYPWTNDSIGTIEIMLKDVVLDNAHDDMTVLLLYAALQYMIKYKDDSGMKDYLTVVRNMLVNTKDKSQREWPRLLPVLKNLVSDNIYELLLDPDLRIEVIYSEQQKEEIRKAKLISINSRFKVLLQKIENDIHFKGNINSLLDGACINGEVDYDTLDKLYKAYTLIAQNDFGEVWGDLLGTNVYKQSEWRVEYDSSYEKHDAVIELAKEVMENNNNVNGVLIRRERKFVMQMQDKYGDLSFVNQPKEQLYLLYILSTRVLKYAVADFFNNGYQFGWLSKNIPGYSSLFEKFYDRNSGMIYQSYSTYFQYNRGILGKRTPKILIAYGAGQKPFDRLIDFAFEKE